MDRYSEEAREIRNHIIDTALEAQKKGHCVCVMLQSHAYDIFVTAMKGKLKEGKPYVIFTGVMLDGQNFAEQYQEIIEGLKALCESNEEEG